MRTLVWFRADLRTDDHPALFHACRDSGGDVAALFVISPDQWREHDWAPVKVEFILRTLRDLSASLARLNIPLIIERTPRFDGQPALVLGVAQRLNCGAVYFNAELEVNESRRDDAVRALLSRHGVAARSFNDQCLVPPGELRTGEGRFYTVFTPFRKALYAALQSRARSDPLPPPRRQSSLPAPPSPVPDRLEGFTSTVPADLWPAGESAARRVLSAFLEKQGPHYKDRRDFPGLDATSRLSPHLAIGSISIRRCLTAAMEANRGRLEGGHDGLATWISELAWREFYRHILVGFPRVCMGRAFKPATERLRWNADEGAFRAWCAGRTGIPIVDAGMRQLAATGWMHNRVRMIAAMHLVKDLFIDWRRGERYFMQNLIDGDLASNNGGWQWSASTGTDAAPYFRIFNPVSQSRRYDPDGAYIRRWVPELAHLPGGEDGPIHDPSALPPLERASLDYPEPLVDRSVSRQRVMDAFRALAE